MRADRIEAALSAARDALREEAHARRQAAKASDEGREDLLRLVAAAVEGLETLAETVAAYAAELPSPAQEAVAIAVRGAWEALEAAGVRLDGEKDEALDLARHRVVKRLGADRVGRDVVAEVVSPGILFKGARVREAAVVATRRD